MASVFAQGYEVGYPILKLTAPCAGSPPQCAGTPGILICTSGQCSGTFVVLYADGMPVTLASLKVSLRICGPSSCVTLDVGVTQISSGKYSYSFTQPSLGNPITVTVPAGHLTDEYGKPFPPVDTQIGSFNSGGATQSSIPSVPATPPPEQANGYEYHQASPQTQAPQASSLTQLALAFTVLLMTLFGVAMFPSRKS
jgi:hypothetical protein